MSTDSRPIAPTRGPSGGRSRVSLRIRGRDPSERATLAALTERYRDGERVADLAAEEEGVSIDRLRAEVKAVSDEVGYDVAEDNRVSRSLAELRASTAERDPLLRSDAVLGTSPLDVVAAYSLGERPEEIADRLSLDVRVVNAALHSEGGSAFRDLRSGHERSHDERRRAGLRARALAYSGAHPSATPTAVLEAVPHRRGDRDFLRGVVSGGPNARPRPVTGVGAEPREDIEEILTERAAGATYRAIGDPRGLSTDQVRRLIASAGPRPTDGAEPRSEPPPPGGLSREGEEERRRFALARVRSYVRRAGLRHVVPADLVTALGVGEGDLAWLVAEDLGVPVLTEAPTGAAPPRSGVDDLVVLALREVARRARTSPLGLAEYEALRDRSRHPSGSLVLTRHPDWPAALASAGLPAPTPSTARAARRPRVPPGA